MKKETLNEKITGWGNFLIGIGWTWLMINRGVVPFSGKFWLATLLAGIALELIQIKSENHRIRQAEKAINALYAANQKICMNCADASGAHIHNADGSIQAPNKKK